MARSRLVLMNSAVLWRNMPFRFRLRLLGAIRFSKVSTGSSTIQLRSGLLLLWPSWFVRGALRAGFGGDFSFGEVGGPSALPWLVRVELR